MNGIIPRQAHFLQDELLQGYPTQLLFGGTAAYVVLAFISDWHIARLNHYLNNFLAFALQQINVTHYAKRGYYLVGYIFQQAVGIADTYYLLIVGNANVDPAALRIGEAAYPFQIFVTPRFFVLYVLIFSHYFASIRLQR